MRTQSGRAGRRDGVAAAAGQIGEILTAQLLAAAATSLVGTGTGTAKTICSQVLGPGAYKCYGSVAFLITGATGTTRVYASVSETDNTEAAGDDQNISGLAWASSTIPAAPFCPTGVPRIVYVPEGQTKTVYLIGRAAFTGGTATACGKLLCERFM